MKFLLVTWANIWDLYNILNSSAESFFVPGAVCQVFHNMIQVVGYLLFFLGKKYVLYLFGALILSQSQLPLTVKRLL